MGQTKLATPSREHDQVLTCGCVQIGGGRHGLPAWLIALIVLCSSVAFIMLLAVIGAVMRALNLGGSGVLPQNPLFSVPHSDLACSRICFCLHHAAVCHERLELHRALTRLQTCQQTQR